MAASTGVHSYSTTLGIDPAGGTTYVTLAEVKEIHGPGIKVGTSKRTNLSSPSAAHEKIPGLIDSGSMSMKLNWVKASYNTVITNLRKSLMGLKITFPLVGAEVTASNLAGNGHFTELGLAIPEDDTIIQDVTIEWSGLPVFTQGS